MLYALGENLLWGASTATAWPCYRALAGRQRADEQILEFVAGLSTALSHEVPHYFDRRGRHGSEKRHVHFCELF